MTIEGICLCRSSAPLHSFFKFRWRGRTARALLPSLVFVAPRKSTAKNHVSKGKTRRSPASVFQIKRGSIIAVDSKLLVKFRRVGLL